MSNNFEKKLSGIDQKKLLKKYDIDESHNCWEATDNWFSVEIYKIITGKLPEKMPDTLEEALDPYIKFLEKKDKFFLKFMEEEKSATYFGSCYLTSKRMIYKIINSQNV